MESTVKWIYTDKMLEAELWQSKYVSTFIQVPFPTLFSLSGCPLNAQALKKGKISEELMTVKLKANGGKEIRLHKYSINPFIY